MKIVSTIAKVLAALATVVGGIYILATYGEQIVAWCKKVLSSLPTVERTVEDDFETVEEPTEETPVEEVPVEEVPVEEVPAEEPVAETDVVADETDFAE